MADQPKSSKFDFQKIISDVKSMISPIQIPEANKSDPVGYYLSEINKMLKDLAEHQTKQADIISKISATVGELYQELKPGATPSQPATAEPPIAEPPAEKKGKEVVEPEPKEAAKEPEEEQ